MKLTLLELVQDMLTAIESENVDSVDDTEESGMCVNIANRSFEEMASAKLWRHFRTYSALSTTATLNELVFPDGTYHFSRKNLYYDGNPVYWLDPDDFLAMTIRRNTADSNITAYNNIKAFTDRDPIYFTSDDDLTLRFDAVPSAISGLDAADTIGIIWKHPTSRLTTDSQYFDMPAIAFNALDLLCMANAVADLKDDDARYDRYYRRYKQELSRLSVRAHLIDKDPDLRESIVARRSLSRIQPPIIGTN